MSISERAVVEWLARYVDVWKSGDESRVAELFSDDAVYYANPFAAPLRGIAEIAEFWAISGDAPDAFEARYEPLTINGDLAIATGFSRYFDASRSETESEYGNIFVLRFAPDGRCGEYREWYMPRDDEMRAT
jgi:ketosteroid isomerase-like protein